MNGIKGYISIREASYRWGVKAHYQVLVSQTESCGAGTLCVSNEAYKEKKRWRMTRCACT